MIIYSALIIYILSLIIGIFLMSAVKSVSRGKFLFIVAVHVLFLLLFIFTKINSSPLETESSTNFSFLFFICSGIILASLTWRSSVNIVAKFYFSLFSITIVMFLFSPSRLTTFLLSGKYSDTLGKTFAVGENYFLEQQITSTSNQPYKLVKKHGIFHEAIQRNITFKGKLDSILVLEFIPNEKTLIRGYSGKTTYVSNDVDSSDVEIRLFKEKQNQIERKLIN